MTRKQFEEWVKENNRKARIDEGLKKIEIIPSSDTKSVIIVNLRNAKTGMAKEKDAMSYDEKKSIAIAYARLHGKEVPEIVEDEVEPEFQLAKRGDEYYCIDFDYMTVFSVRENGAKWCREDEKIGNYFLTEERAKEVLDKIKMLLFLEKMHDTYCPEYKPDFDDYKALKHCVRKIAGSYSGRWECAFGCPTEVYFATEEIAKKVADALNDDAESSE